MSDTMNHNTRRALQAIAKRNREDAQTIARIAMDYMLKAKLGVYSEKEFFDELMWAIETAKCMADRVEKILDKTDPEKPAIERKRGGFGEND
jgi:hypothetical protein